MKSKKEIQEEQLEKSLFKKAGFNPIIRGGAMDMIAEEELFKARGYRDIEREQHILANKILEQMGMVQQQNTQPIVEKNEDVVSPNIFYNLDKYFNDFIEHRKSFKGVSNSSLKSYTASMKYLKHLSCEDTVFNFKYFKELQKKLQEMPKNFFKYSKYYEITFEELLEVKEQENYETMVNKTINGHISNFRIFFDYLKYEEIINDNPMNDIRPLPETKGTEKIEFSSEDLDNIFSSAIEIDYINMCKVALYCGLRIEEVLSIKKENITENFIYVDIEDTDTKKHQRIIPIHNNLLPVIERQIRQNKGEYIFFHGNVANEVSSVGKRINRRLEKIVPENKKTFHSFRKNFSQEIELNTDAEEKVKKYLMGHDMGKNITHSIYNRGKVNTDKLVNCINQITFEY